MGGGQTLEIGSDTTVSSQVLITNVDHDYTQIDVSIMEQPTVAKKTSIGRNCFIGHSVTILAGAQIGNHCIIGANSVVKEGYYPDYSVLVGSPARIVKKYDPEINKWVKVTK